MLASRRNALGGAGGTGLQEFTCQVHLAGYGISHAIGTGSHDLSERIGGLTTLAALNALEADHATQVIAIISKPPSLKTLERLLARIVLCRKPVIGCFLGIPLEQLSGKQNIRIARTIDDAVWLACAAIGTDPDLPEARLPELSWAGIQRIIQRLDRCPELVPDDLLPKWVHLISLMNCSRCSRHLITDASFHPGGAHIF